MEKESAAKEGAFKITLFTAMDMKGIMRNSQGPPWGDNKKIADELKKAVREKIMLMGRKTYESLPDDIIKDLSSEKGAGMTFVITSKPGYKIKKGHSRIAIIHSMATIPEFWWALEEKYEQEKAAEIKKFQEVRADAKQKLPGLKKDPELAAQLEKEISRIEQRPLPISPEIVVAGGISLYNELLDYATTIYAFLVYEEFKGDEPFPLFANKNEWIITKSADSAEKRADGQCVYTSICYGRRGPPKKFLSFFRPNLPPLGKPEKK